MANIRSQIKRNRQNVVRQFRNRSMRSEIRTRIKRAMEAVQAGEGDRAVELARSAQKRIDMAAARGIIHPRTAARRKARLAREIRG